MKFDCLIKNGKIWDGQKFLSDADSIGVVGNRVVEIGNNLNGGNYVIDAKGSIISCGLIDIHTHIKGCGSDYFGVPGETACFPFGVTTAVEAWTDKDGTTILDNMLLDTFVFIGVGITNNHADFTLTDKLINIYKDRVLGVKICFDQTQGLVQDKTSLVEVCAYARKKGLKVLVHSTGSPIPMREIFETLSNGDICTHIFHGGKNNVSDDNYDCLKYAIKKGIILDNGMAGGVHTDFEVAKNAIKNGFLPDTISTDITKVSAFMRGGNYGMTLCMSIMRSLGITETDILKSITFNPVKVIGKSDFAGKLSVGSRADICILNYEKSPFEIYDRAGNYVKNDYGYVNLFTMKNGQTVFRGNI